MIAVPPRFRKDTDETLVRYWNEREGSISWLTELEAELERRGYSPRDKEGHRRTLTIASDME